MRNLKWIVLAAVVLFPKNAKANNSDVSHVFAQVTGHSTTLTWNAPSNAAACVTPCTLGYNVFRGTAAGAESSTPINAAIVTTLSYTDPITLTGVPQTFFYTVQAVETIGSVTAVSTQSNEVSATFPGIPGPPQNPVAAPTLVQVAAARSQTGAVSATLTNQSAGDDNIVLVAFCENACSLPPDNDKVRVGDTAGNFCAVLGSVQNGNENLSMWRCPRIKASLTNTIHGYVFLGANEPPGATIRTSIAVSEWSALGTLHTVPQTGDYTLSGAIGPNGGPGNGMMAVHTYNGDISAEAGPWPIAWICPSPMASINMAFGS